MGTKFLWLALFPASNTTTFFKLTIPLVINCTVFQVLLLQLIVFGKAGDTGNREEDTGSMEGDTEEDSEGGMQEDSKVGVSRISF